MTTLNVNDFESISNTIQHYIKGAVLGSGDAMKPAFHTDATIFGYIGEDLFAGPIQKLFDWNDSNGPAKDLVAKITNIDIVGSVASARVESEKWTGNKFTDFFNLLKVNGEWKIMNKIFYLHN